MTSPNRVPRSSAPSLVIWGYIVALGAAAGAVFYATYNLTPWGPRAFLTFLVLSGIAVLMVSSRQPADESVAISLASAVNITAIVVLGPAAAIGVAATGYALGRKKTALRARLFNVSMVAAMVGIAGGVYVLSGGMVGPPFRMGFAEIARNVAPQLLLANAVQMVANQVILAGRIWLAQPIPYLRTLSAMIVNPGILNMAYGALAFLVVVLWGPAGLGLWSIVLLAAPMITAQWTLNQYGEERRSHGGIVRALVAGAEVGSPAIPGHAQRVARLVRVMMPALELSPRQAEALEYAAQLHDIGIVALPAKARLGGPVLSAEDMKRLAQHPHLGTEILKDLPFLAPALPAILHHHERYDGTGYPDGLAGDAIPLGARVVAVADAFDSLVLPSPLRRAFTVDETLAELRRRSGTHLDGAVVEALAQGIARQGWAVEPELAEVAESTASHDDPRTSDLWSSWRVEGAV